MPHAGHSDRCRDTTSWRTSESSGCPRHLIGQSIAGYRCGPELTAFRRVWEYVGQASGLPAGRPDACPTKEGLDASFVFAVLVPGTA
jgi:hypothetical protein